MSAESAFQPGVRPDGARALESACRHQRGSALLQDQAERSSAQFPSQVFAQALLRCLKCLNLCSPAAVRRPGLARAGFVFTYRIVITNTGHERVRLLSRRWEIIDFEGAEESVQGPGVVGKNPDLLPGQEFEYTSSRRIP